MLRAKLRLVITKREADPSSSLPPAAEGVSVRLEDGVKAAITSLASSTLPWWIR
jgi:hypothetical protein